MKEMKEIVEKYFESMGVEVTEKQVKDVCSYCRRKEIKENPSNIMKFLGDRPHLVRALLVVGFPE